MTEYSQAFKRQAVERARELGTKTAARELGVDSKTLRMWRRAENRAENTAAIRAEIDQLERDVEEADDLDAIGAARERIEELTRRLGYDPIDVLLHG